MASTDAAPSASGEELTPAQKMTAAAKAHAQHFHVPTVEDDPEEVKSPVSPPPAPAPAVAAPTTNGSTGYAMSAKAAGKQPAQASPGASQAASKPPVPAFKVTEDAFPSLGPTTKAPAATTWGQRPSSAANAHKTGKAANGASGASTPSSTTSAQAQNKPFSLPGQHSDSIAIPKKSLKSPLPKTIAQIILEVTKRTAVKIEASHTTQGGQPVLLLKANGPSEALVREKLRLMSEQLCKKEQEHYLVPASVRGQIIGKGGSKIKQIQESSRARVQVPKDDPSAVDEDGMIQILLEGDALAIRLAKAKVDEIVGVRPAQSTHSSTTMKDLPPEFFPFLNSPVYTPELAQHRENGMEIQIPHYHTWRDTPPASKPHELTARDGHHIQIRGHRDSAAEARAVIDARVQELRQQLAIEELMGIETNRHRFILNTPGFDLNDFVRETGCSLILPSDDSETIYVVGPPDRIEEGKDKAIDLASSMINNPVDVARQYQGPAESRAQYLRNVNRYMQRRQGLADAITKQHNAQISYPSDTSQPLTVWTRDARAGVKARQDVLNTISAHPHQRFRNMNVHPFYQRNMEEQHARHLREQHGVHLIRPDAGGDDDQILLVFEDREPAPQYSFPQRRPAADEVAQFEQALQEAEAYLMQAIGEQQEIISREMEAPVKYRERLSRYASRQDSGSPYPVRYTGLDRPTIRGGNFPISVQGPANEVDDSAARLLAFIEQEIRDEAERDFTTTCTFPQQLQGRLIGKDGSNIRKISEDFDVRVDTVENSNEVRIKGPPAKAEAAKAHIQKLAREAEDETTHQLIIEPQYHAELIGKSGANILRYQEKYNCQILFPKAQSGNADSRRAAQGPNQVLIKGSKRQADSAKDDLHALYTAIKSQSYSATVMVRPDQVPGLIGRGGAEAEALRAEHGCKIDFPKPKDDVDASGRQKIQLRGSKEAVEAVRRALETKIAAFEDTINQSIPVARKHYSPLIGQDGENLKSMISAAGGDPTASARIVQIPKPASEEEVVRLVGPSNVVNALLQSIAAFVAARESQVTETMIVPADRHGALIGQNGTVKRSIQDDHRIVMNIPGARVEGPAREKISLTGDPANIEAARERINAILAQGGRRGSGRTGGASETVQVAHGLHHTIADDGKFFRTLRRDFDVAVDHGSQRPPPKQAPPTFTQDVASMPTIMDNEQTSGPSAEDIMNNHQWQLVTNDATTDEETIAWILKGTDANVAQAKTRLEAALSAAEGSATGYLLLPDPSTTHGLIIGPNGSVINEIRANTGCGIQVPKAGKEGPVELIGSPESIEASKAAILAAVVEGLSNGGGRRGGRRSPTGGRRSPNGGR